MAASKDIVANKEAISAFEPSLWGDFFVTYTSPPLQACICNFISCQHAIFFISLINLLCNNVSAQAEAGGVDAREEGTT